MKISIKNTFRILISGVAMTALLPAVSSCDDRLSDITVNQTPVTVIIEMPEEAQQGKKITETYKFSNISTGQEQKFTTSERISLIPGLYDFSYEARFIISDGREMQLRGKKSSVTVTGNPMTLEVEAFCSVENDDLTIAEIFFSGTLQTSGNQYNGDDYVKLYNNTGHVVYADGLTIFETKFTTVNKYDYTPDIMNEAVTVHALYTVPGSGKDHPIQPGEYFLIADTGIDHRVANPNSFDLSHADFEWYDVSTAPNHLDIDGPVPNLDKWYCYTLSFWLLHNRGFKAYGIARIPVERYQYLKDYWYTYDYVIDVPAGTFPMSGSAYRLPNEWIVDIVNCSVESEYAWNLCAPSLDMGWTHCGTVDGDKTRYFHSVRRKMLYLDDNGHPVLKDTNNSTEDFNSDCTPSEIELQGTAMDVYGTPCKSVTYDGVTPVKK